MRFAFVQEHCSHISVERLCRIMNIISRGYRAWRCRPSSQHQRDDMVLLVPIRKQHHLNLGSYGRPRMTQELKEIGLNHAELVNFQLVFDKKSRIVDNSNGEFMLNPNILFIQVDQLTAESLKAYGNSVCHTPNLDRIAAEGIVVDDAYCNFPLCSPSRA